MLPPPHCKRSCNYTCFVVRAKHQLARGPAPLAALTRGPCQSSARSLSRTLTLFRSRHSV
eukprot:6493043-Pyramimonas_sp.AAC.1